MGLLARYDVNYDVDLMESSGTDNPFPIPYDFQPKNVVEFSLDELWSAGNIDAIVELIELFQFGEPWRIVRTDEEGGAG